MVNAEALGERKIIDIILKRLEQMPNMPIPFGDDVSAVDLGDGRLAVIKTDMLVGRTDVPPKMNMTQAARKAVIMNISDLAAKGVKTIALLVSLGIPKDVPEKDIERIAEGLNAGAREYDAYILGGDTSEASDIIISCSAFGVTEKNHLMLRSGARPHDIVAVTGEFGKTASGLQILLKNKSLPMRLKTKLVDAVLMPKARLSEGLTLARTGAVTSSIDSSDGLAWSLLELSRASNVGFIINHLPIAKDAKDFARLCRVDPIQLCLYGGEEYELVVTVKPELFEKVTEKVPLTKIGHATAKKTLALRVDGKQIPMEAKGWEHFKTTLPRT